MRLGRCAASHVGVWTIRAHEGEAMVARARTEHSGEPREVEPSYVVANRAALIGVAGVLSKYGTYLADGVSTVSVRHALRTANADPLVSRIVLCIESPGGSSMGIGELVDDIRASTKPVDAYVSDLCASGALWIASACRTVTANATAWIGSIGAYIAVCDMSVAMEREGIAVRVFRSAPAKGFAMGEPITDPMAAEWQREVDMCTAQFVADLSKGRKRDLSALATGEMWTASEAVSLGLIDAIGTLDGVLLETAMSDKAAAVNAAKPDEGSVGLCKLPDGTEQESTREECDAMGGEYSEPTDAPADAPAEEAAAQAATKVAATAAQLVALPGASVAFVQRAIAKGLTLTEATHELLGELSAGTKARERKAAAGGSFNERAKALAKDEGIALHEAMSRVARANPALNWKG